MAKKVCVGVIGAGGIAGTHIKYLQQIEGVEVVAVCDIREDALKRTAESFNIAKTFANHRDLVALKELHAVTVCTPNYFHAEPTIDALKAGKHVMVEKPMSMTVKESEAMVATARQTGRKLVIGFQSRYSPAAQMIQRSVEAGELGKVLYSRCQALRRRGIPSWGVFGQKSLQGGGPLIDIGVHIIEVAHYLMGRPQPISASASCYTYLGDKPSKVKSAWGAWDHETYTVEDLAVGLVRFDNGATLFIEASFAAHLESDVFNFTLMGDKGGASFDPPRIYKDEAGTMFNMVPHFVGSEDQFALKMQDFIAVVRGEKKSTAPGEDGLTVQKILEGVYKSAETGKEVRIK
ncbi:MAG: Gfo/Idh/MocA family oxidoreductase [Armatimonadetes bacterium]|nr:Gfo/Idh/MocA family oxidoreductase [Armatimonadota bacterium]